jgi:hypothetical protein
MSFIDRLSATLASVSATAGSGNKLMSLRKVRRRINRAARLRVCWVPTARNLSIHDLGERISGLEAVVKPLLEQVNSQSTPHQVPSSDPSTPAISAVKPQPRSKEIENINQKIDQAEKIWATYSETNLFVPKLSRWSELYNQPSISKVVPIVC